MQIQVSQNQFHNAFRDCGRQDQFSYAALNALFEYYEEVAEFDDLEFDLDPIAICCEWSEYKTPKEAAAAYEGEGAWGSMTEDDANKSALIYLQERTQVIEFNGGIVAIDF